MLRVDYGEGGLRELVEIVTKVFMISIFTFSELRFLIWIGE